LHAIAVGREDAEELELPAGADMSPADLCRVSAIKHMLTAWMWHKSLRDGVSVGLITTHVCVIWGLYYLLNTVLADGR
jgi:hypothetical protein